MDYRKGLRRALKREPSHSRRQQRAAYTGGMRTVPLLRPRQASGRPAPLLPWLTAALLLGLAVPADAQWMWRDKDGRVTASDRPPPATIADKDILSRPPQRAAQAPGVAPAAAASAPAATASAAAAAGPVATNTPLDRELEARKRAAEQQQAARQKAEEDKLAATRAENCRRARSHAAALESGQRIARFNAQGEQEVLDDAGRAEEMRRARELIASDCR